MTTEAERLLGLDQDIHAECDRALSREAEDNLRLIRDADKTATRDALLLRLLAYTDGDNNPHSLHTAIHHVRLLLGHPGRPDPDMVRRLLDDLGGDP